MAQAEAETAQENSANQKKSSKRSSKKSNKQRRNGTPRENLCVIWEDTVFPLVKSGELTIEETADNDDSKHNIFTLKITPKPLDPGKSKNMKSNVPQLKAKEFLCKLDTTCEMTKSNLLNLKPPLTDRCLAIGADGNFKHDDTDYKLLDENYLKALVPSGTFSTIISTWYNEYVQPDMKQIKQKAQYNFLPLKPDDLTRRKVVSEHHIVNQLQNSLKNMWQNCGLEIVDNQDGKPKPAGLKQWEQFKELTGFDHFEKVQDDYDYAPKVPLANIENDFGGRCPSLGVDLNKGEYGTISDALQKLCKPTNQKGKALQATVNDLRSKMKYLISPLEQPRAYPPNIGEDMSKGGFTMIPNDVIQAAYQTDEVPLYVDLPVLCWWSYQKKKNDDVKVDDGKVDDGKKDKEKEVKPYDDVKVGLHHLMLQANFMLQMFEIYFTQTCPHFAQFYTAFDKTTFDKVVAHATGHKPWLDIAVFLQNLDNAMSKVHGGGVGLQPVHEHDSENSGYHSVCKVVTDNVFPTDAASKYHEKYYLKPKDHNDAKDGDAKDGDAKVEDARIPYALLESRKSDADHFFVHHIESLVVELWQKCGLMKSSTGIKRWEEFKKLTGFEQFDDEQSKGVHVVTMTSHEIDTDYHGKCPGLSLRSNEYLKLHNSLLDLVNLVELNGFEEKDFIKTYHSLIDPPHERQFAMKFKGLIRILKPGFVHNQYFLNDAYVKNKVPVYIDLPALCVWHAQAENEKEKYKELKDFLKQANFMLDLFEIYITQTYPHFKQLYNDFDFKALTELAKDVDPKNRDTLPWLKQGDFWDAVNSQTDSNKAQPPNNGDAQPVSAVRSYDNIWERDQGKAGLVPYVMALPAYSSRDHEAAPLIPEGSNSLLIAGILGIIAVFLALICCMMCILTGLKLWKMSSRNEETEAAWLSRMDAVDQMDDSYQSKV